MENKANKNTAYRIFSPNLIPRLAKEDLCYVSIGKSIKKVILLSLFLFLVVWALGGLLFLKMKNEKQDLAASLSIDKYGDKLTELEKSNSYSKESRVFANKIEKSLDRQYKFSNFLEELIKLTPRGLVINSLETALDQPGSIKIIGLAKERDGFLKFKDNLEKSEYCEKVDSPLANFVDPENLNFELTVKLKNWKPAWGESVAASSSSAAAAKTKPEEE